MYKQLKINRAFNKFLIETFEFTDEQLEALDYQIPMTQETYNSILDRCVGLRPIADDLFYRLLWMFTITLRIRKEWSGRLPNWMKFRLCKGNLPCTS